MQANATSVVLSSVVDIAVDLPLMITLHPGRSHFRYFFIVYTSCFMCFYVVFVLRVCVTVQAIQDCKCDI